MSRSTGWAASALVAIALAGCGDGSSGPELLATFCDEEAVATCARQGACDPTELIGQAECVELELAACRPKLATLAEAARAGRLAFSAPAAEACLQVLEQGSCTEFSDACAGIFVGTADPGAPCDPELDLSFAGGFLPVVQCRLGACPAACGGTCPAVAQIGEPCTAAVCEEGARCSGVTGRCTAPLSSGESCRDRIYSCASDLFCGNGSGLPCHPADDPTCTCRELLPAGAACGPDPWWVSFSLCAGGLCFEGECRRLGAQPGDLCLATRDCQAGQTCVTSPVGAQPGVCKALGAEGAACESSQECLHGLVCRTSGECGAPSPAGSPCAPGSRWLTDCGPWMACLEGVCAAPCVQDPSCSPSGVRCHGGCAADPGVACDVARDCPLDHACDGGVCARGAKAGASCRWGIACASGICAVGADGEGTCFDPSSCGWVR